MGLFDRKEAIWNSKIKYKIIMRNNKNYRFKKKLYYNKSRIPMFNLKPRSKSSKLRMDRTRSKRFYLDWKTDINKIRLNPYCKFSYNHHPYAMMKYFVRSGNLSWKRNFRYKPKNYTFRRYFG